MPAIWDILELDDGERLQASLDTVSGAFLLLRQPTHAEWNTRKVLAQMSRMESHRLALEVETDPERLDHHQDRHLVMADAVMFQAVRCAEACAGVDQVASVRRAIEDWSEFERLAAWVELAVHLVEWVSRPAKNSSAASGETPSGLLDAAARNTSSSTVSSKPASLARGIDEGVHMHAVRWTPASTT